MSSIRIPQLLIALARSAGTAPLAAQDAVPDSATIAAGKTLFEGRGLCYSCHGKNGEGVLGPTTRLDGRKEWLHSDGTLAGVIAIITSGVSGDSSVSGSVMPPRGGARLTPQQIEQIAAYVLTLHRRKPAP